MCIEQKSSFSFSTRREILLHPFRRFGRNRLFSSINLTSLSKTPSAITSNSVSLFLKKLWCNVESWGLIFVADVRRQRSHRLLAPETHSRGSPNIAEKNLQFMAMHLAMLRNGALHNCVLICREYRIARVGDDYRLFATYESQAQCHSASTKD